MLRHSLGKSLNQLTTGSLIAEDLVSPGPLHTCCETPGADHLGFEGTRIALHHLFQQIEILVQP